MSLGPGTSALTPTMVDPPRAPLRVDTVRLQFDRRAARFARHDAPLREVERRLLERLDCMKLAPRRIAEVGCGAGHARAAFAARYPAAQWVGLDLSRRMLDPTSQRGAPLRRLLRAVAPAPALIQAEAGALPFRDDSVDLLFSSLMLHWHPRPHTLFSEWKRVLRADGLLLFSCLGPDSLRQLRAAFAEGWPQARPLAFVDMHDYGDMMVAAGFAAPVMEVEVLTLTYGSPQTLLREAAAFGGNPRDDRCAGLPSTRQARAVVDALAAQRDGEGRIALTLEIVYGHAWKPTAPAGRAGVATVSLDRLRESLPRRG
jgi:malonyl-CoA O-methyltransferase